MIRALEFTTIYALPARLEPISVAEIASHAQQIARHVQLPQNVPIASQDLLSLLALALLVLMELIFITSTVLLNQQRVHLR